MTRNPIRKVLLTLRSHGVRYLLMGGQACVFYGGAEFSRDTDITLLASPANLNRLNCALRELQAECIAVPPLELEYLLRGHAVHFRCRHLEADGMRLDIMARMRGMPDFKVLWKRRTTITIRPNEVYELLSLPDLIAAKKTQRDKDWIMIRRLAEAHYHQHRAKPSRKHIHFWLMNSRTAEHLTTVSSQYPRQRKKQMADRKVLAFAEKGRGKELAAALLEEEQSEREADRQYWAPLKAELETLRHLKIRRKVKHPAASRGAAYSAEAMLLAAKAGSLRNPAKLVPTRSESGRGEHQSEPRTPVPPCGKPQGFLAKKGKKKF